MIQNAIGNPKLKAETFKTRFLEAGVVKYDEVKKDGVVIQPEEWILIKPENLMRIADKFNGAKVIIDHKDVDASNASEEIVGYASNIRQEADGWAWCDFTVNSQEAIDLINNGFKPSCAYLPLSTGSGGTKNNVPYDREVIDIKEDDEVTHIAIVEKPRYEEAIILKNSIKKNIMNIFKIKKEVKENSKIKKEVKENSAKEHELELANSVFEMEDGEQVPLSNIVEAYRNAKEEEKKIEKENECEDKKVKINADDEFEVDGEMIKVSEMAKSFKASKKNAEEEEAKKNAEEEAKEEEEKKNAEDEVKKEEEDVKKAKKNSVDAERISKAKAKFENGVASEIIPSSYTSDSERFALGASAYGEPVKIAQ